MGTFMSKEEAALALFNGDEEKAKTLLTLIGDTGLSCPPEEFNRNMQLPQYDCGYCTDGGECWHDMPDSMFQCKGKCEFFTERSADEPEVVVEGSTEPVDETLEMGTPAPEPEEESEKEE